MKKRTSIINTVISLLITVGLLFLTVQTLNKRNTDKSISILFVLILAVILDGFIVTLLHELGHMVFGKLNGFKLISFSVWFFKWTRVKDKFRFSFSFFFEEAGSTEMVSLSSEKTENRFKKQIMGGSVFTAIIMLFGVVPFFLEINYILFVFWALFLPIGSYTFFGNALPMTNNGVYNDGAVYRLVNKNTDQGKVIVSALKIQTELYNGKTPSEIDQSLYFDLPQLCEDDYYFLILLNLRYNYYLDMGDFENAKSITERALTLLDYMPKGMQYVFKTDALYGACTYDFNEDKADEYMYELEKYLNNNNTATNIRVKLAYIIKISKDTAPVEIFLKKGIRESKRCVLKGEGIMEKRLMEELTK